MPTLDEVISGHAPDSYIDALPSNQRQLLQLLYDSGNDDWQIVGLWLKLSGPPFTFPMGSGHNPDFSTRFRTELRDLLCDAARYGPQRKQLLSQGEITQAALIAAVSAILGPALGTAAVFVATPVAVGLKVVARLGIGAWCAGEQVAAPAGISPPDPTAQG